MTICAQLIETLLGQANSLPVNTQDKKTEEDDICMDDSKSDKKKKKDEEEEVEENNFKTFSKFKINTKYFFCPQSTSMFNFCFQNCFRLRDLVVVSSA